MEQMLIKPVPIVRWRAYFALCKPKVVTLILFTALVGMCLATPGAVPFDTLAYGMLGIGLAAASGAAFNHLIDRRLDGIMARTRHRPLPSGELEPEAALRFAAVLGIAAMTVLVVRVNMLTALLTLLSLLGYALIYTRYLKWRTSQNIVWGGLAGAMPALLGWAAVRGSIDVQPLALVFIVFLWTPPHFWPLAIVRRADYARGGVPMLPVTHGVDHTCESVLLYTLALMVATVLPYASGLSGLPYLAAAFALNAGYLYYASRLFIEQTDRAAYRTFRYSIVYLALLFSALLADHYLG